MTKVAITGPATGTGTYTLRAPDTASTLDFELPTVGTHLASAQADGMPLGTGGDPVVESGSNTDGEWVRWADGTQQCYRKDTSTVRITDTAAGSIYAASSSVTYIYPQPFALDADKLIVSTACNYVPSGGAVIWGLSRDVTLTGCAIGLYSHANVGKGYTGYSATGRWK